MKRALFTVVTFVAAIASLAPFASAQDHGQVGAFVDYLHLGETNSNFAGLGGRAAFNANRYIGFEAEISYDFNQVFSEQFTPTGISNNVGPVKHFLSRLLSFHLKEFFSFVFFRLLPSER